MTQNIESMPKKNYGNDEGSELALSFFARLINDHKIIYLKDISLEIRFL